MATNRKKSPTCETMLESILAGVVVLDAAGVAVEANAAAGHEIGIEELERRQSLWWFLLGAGLLLLIIEAVVASRLPRIAS